MLQLAKGWYIRNEADNTVYYWTGEHWGARPLDRAIADKEAVKYSVFGGAGGKVHEKRQREQGPKLSCIAVILIIILAVIVIGYFTGKVTEANQPSRHPSMTEANGLGRCEEAIEDRTKSPTLTFAIDGQTLGPAGESQTQTYKATLRSQLGSDLRHWQCILTWQGDSWSVDQLIGS